MTALRPLLRAGRWEYLAAVLLAALTLLAVGAELRVIPALFIAAVTPALVRTDLADRRLPNRVVLPALAVAVIVALASWAITSRPPLVAALSGAIYFLFMLVLGIVGGMGMGDVKLAAPLGIAAGLLGPTVAVLSPLVAFIAGGAVAAVALARRIRAIPFGPFMLLGFWVAILLARLGGLS